MTQASGKPLLRLNLDLTESEPGGILDVLVRIEDSRSFHSKYDLRPPLGIYNVSIQRLDQRIARAADALEAYTKRVKTIREGLAPDEAALIADTLESCIYAAAEHVDDLESCLLVLFDDHRAFAKSKAVRDFKKTLAPIRRNVSAFANAIKHAQARIRLFRFGFLHAQNSLVLTGFFIEGVKGGVVGPSEAVHGSDDKVISISAFLWEVIVFVHFASDLLIDALGNVLGNPIEATPSRDRYPILLAGVPAAARLPLLALDGAHPFETISLQLNGETLPNQFSSDDLYGSLGNRWSKTRSHAFQGASQDYIGDGVTRSFAMVQPKSLRILHWD